MPVLKFLLGGRKIYLLNFDTAISFNKLTLLK